MHQAFQVFDYLFAFAPELLLAILIWALGFLVLGSVALVRRSRGLRSKTRTP